jgi:hypothetical protein
VSESTGPDETPFSQPLIYKGAAEAAAREREKRGDDQTPDGVDYCRRERRDGGMAKGSVQTGVLLGTLETHSMMATWWVIA